MDADKVTRRLAERIAAKWEELIRAIAIVTGHKPQPPDPEIKAAMAELIERDLAPVRELIAIVERVAASHDECDDPWYSCPKHPDYTGSASRGKCLCGADDARVALSKLDAEGEER